MAARNLGTLTVDVVAKTGGLTQGMEKAERETSKRMDKIAADAKKAGAAIGIALAGISTAIAVGVRNTIKEIDKLSLMSDQIGVTTEALSGLRYAAEQMAGVSEGQFDMALRRMTRRITEAADGAGPAAAALRALGLSAEELAKLSPDEQFRRLADAMKQTEDQGTRLRATMAIFDTEGMPLVNMLKEGAEGIRQFEEEANRLGVTIDGQTAAAARAFGKELNTLNAIKDGLYNSITAELLPTLVALTRRFTETTNGVDGFSKATQIAANGVKLLVSVGAWVIGTFKTWGEAIGGVAAAMGALLSGNFREAADIVKMVGSDIVQNIKDTVSTVESVWDDVNVNYEVPARKLAAPVSFAVEKVKAEGKKVVSEAEKIYQQVEQRLAQLSTNIATFGMDEGQRLVFEIELQGATPEQIARAQSLTDTLRRLREEEEEREKAQERQKRAQFVLDTLNLEIEALGKSAEWIAKRNALLNAGVTAESEMGQAIIATVEELYRQGEAMEAQIEAMDSFRSSAADALSDFISGSKSAKEAAIDFLDSFRKRLMDMISERLMDQLFGQLGQGGGGMFGDFFGGLFGGIFGGGRASGGAVGPNRIYEVNEAGMEMLTVRGRDYLLTGNNSGEITPAHELSGGPNVTINQNFAPGTPDEVRRAAGAGARSALSFMNNAQRYA